MLERGGKRVARPNNPEGGSPEEKVRKLQRQLWTCAKRSRSRRFHALYDRIWRGDVLREAWRRVKVNGGAAGVEEVSIGDIEERGAGEYLKEIQTVLKAGRYRPSPVRRRYIPKGDGRQRPLGIPTVRDRVVQMATKLVIEPIFEADFEASIFGFRARKNATQAMEVIREAGNHGYNVVLDADIRDYFGSIDHGKLLALVKERISDRRVPKLIGQWPPGGPGDRVHEMTDVRGRQSQDLGELIERLNGTTSMVACFDGSGDEAGSEHASAATPRKPCQENSSVSCVRENCTHSLKGGAGNGSR